MSYPKPYHYLLLTGVTFLAGIVFYGFYNEFIIIHYPVKEGKVLLSPGTTKRKCVQLFYWNNEMFLTEEKDILYSPDRIATLSELIMSWLTVDAEEYGSKKVSLDTVLLDFSGNEAFISFDRNPFAKEASIVQKLMWIQSLLKTIRESGLSLTTVRFLVRSRPLEDTHIDFSHSWPLSGYLEQES